MNSFDFIAVMLGMRSFRFNFGGGGSPAGPTAQQQALQTEQAVTNAQLNLEENEQRKTILNALQGTRVFRGSALSRQVAGNAAAPAAPAAPSASQQSPVVKQSLLDQNLPFGVSPQTPPAPISSGRGAPAAAAASISPNPGR